MAIVNLIFNYLKSVHPSAPEDTLTDEYAMVFIDELDAHLHPSWQRKLLGLLRNCFPHVQFVVASHSPLVVAGCKENEVAVLRKKENERGFYLQEIEQHFVGATTSELYQSLFEIEEKDEAYLKYAAMYPFRKDILKEIQDYEDKKKLTAAEEDTLQSLYNRNRDFSNARTMAQRILANPDRAPEEEDEEIIQSIYQMADLTSKEEQTLSNIDEKLRLNQQDEQTLESLLKKQFLEPEDAKRLDDLHEQIYYIREFGKVEKRKEKNKSLEEQNKKLQSEVNELKSEIQQYQSRSSTLHE